MHSISLHLNNTIAFRFVSRQLRMQEQFYFLHLLQLYQLLWSPLSILSLFVKSTSRKNTPFHTILNGCDQNQGDLLAERYVTHSSGSKSKWTGCLSCAQREELDCQVNIQSIMYLICQIQYHFLQLTAQRYYTCYTKRIAVIQQERRQSLEHTECERVHESTDEAISAIPARKVSFH